MEILELKNSISIDYSFAIHSPNKIHCPNEIRFEVWNGVYTERQH